MPLAITGSAPVAPVRAAAGLAAARARADGRRSAARHCPSDTAGPRQTLAQHAGQRVDVGAVGDLISGEPLRGHVIVCPQSDSALGQPGVTSGGSASLPTGRLTGSPVAYLTYPIWTFYNLPSKTAQDLSYDAAFLLIVFLLVLIIAGRVISSFARRHSEYL